MIAPSKDKRQYVRPENIENARIISIIDTLNAPLRIGIITLDNNEEYWLHKLVSGYSFITLTSDITNRYIKGESFGNKILVGDFILRNRSLFRVLLQGFIYRSGSANHHSFYAYYVGEIPQQIKDKLN